MTSRASLQATLADRLGSANEARWMLDAVLGRKASDVDAAAQRVLCDMVARRLDGEPLQYVLGSWAFRTLDLMVDTRALIPRPETEQVAEIALAELRRALADRRSAPASTPASTPASDRVPASTPDPDRVLVADLGTGTGAIALSIAAELGAAEPGLLVIGTDVDPATLELASANLGSVELGHPQVTGHVSLRQGSWFSPLDAEWRGHLDLVVANPPYVSEEEWACLDREVRHEPYGALVAGPGADGTPGFAAVEAVLAGAHEWLAEAGVVVVEMATHHAPCAASLGARIGYREVRVEPDLAGRARAVVGRK